MPCFVVSIACNVGQIKAETGRSTYLLKLRYAATVADIYAAIDKQRYYSANTHTQLD